jgi:hypothetical protein
MDHPSSSMNSPESTAARRAMRMAWILVAGGLVLRLYHYLRNSPVWCDELWILRNIVNKGFLELLGPLSDVQAAPPLFLWIERCVWHMLGSNIYAMRFLPVLASCVGLVLLIPLGRRCLDAAALPWAVLLLGCSSHMMDYTCDVKPYTTDCLLGIAIPLLCLSTRGWQYPRRLALFAALAPVVIFLSYPGCFIYGGLILAMLPGLWHNRKQWSSWAAFTLLVLCTLLSFYLLLVGPIRAQRTSALDACWVNYPNWRSPHLVPFWSVEVFVQLLEHLWRPTGPILVVPAVLGAFSMWRRNKGVELVVLAMPGVLAMMAAWMHAYPFESRLLLFAAGPLALVIGEGISVCLQYCHAWMERCELRGARNARTALASIVLLCGLALSVPFGITLYHIIDPHPRLTVEKWPEETASR